MITIHLTGQAEKVAANNPWNFALPPLYHQWRTFHALQDPTTWLVVNTYNTGTGKTRASLLHLLTLNSKPAAQKNVLFIAPTNALLTQHVHDIKEFVQEQQLDFHVEPVTAATNRQLKALIETAGHYDNIRPGEVLYRLVRNYREFAPSAEKRQGLILVVNPDIFYYALLFQYGPHDQRNLFQQFLESFSYTIIDEFHYYDQKQLCFFLFFFAISRELGYFEHSGRRICLLSATPHRKVIEYLDQLFADRWQLISPQNESTESISLATTPTLSPLTLTFINEDLVEWGKQNGHTLRQWLIQEKQDGAIISDSLRRINLLESVLRPSLENYIGRITGPEPEKNRQSATKQQLILATPTVDIGYNFDKVNKSRQNIDFLITEARFGDDLIQRIGRAGRILPKPIKDQFSHAIVLLRDEMLDVLRPYHNQTLSRTQFSQIVHDNMPHKHNLWQYICSWGITEVFYPIYQVHRLSLPDVQERLENLYKTLFQLFQSSKDHTKLWQLSQYFRAYYKRSQWLHNSKNKPLIYDKRNTAEQFCTYTKFHGQEYQLADIQQHLDHPNLLGSPAKEEALRYFVASQYHLTKSLFNFRDSFDPGTAVVYDPDHWLSTETINTHDLLHIAGNFQVRWLDNRTDFLQECDQTNLFGQHYGIILGHRQPHLKYSLHLTAYSIPALENEDEFRKYWTCRPITLKGIRLQATTKDGSVPLPEHIRNSLQDNYLPILLLPHELQGKAIRYLRQTTLYNYSLTVTFAMGKQVEYMAYLGKAAWLAHAELRRDIYLAQKLQETAIII